MRSILLAALLASLLAACGGTGPAGSPDPGGSSDDPGADAMAGPHGAWVLVEPAPATDVPDGARITLTIEDDDGRVRAGGRAACNYYDASVRIEGEAWAVGSLSRTHIGCDPARLDADSSYLNWLMAIETWSRPEADVLELTRGATTLTFARLPEAGTSG